jgi:hypothetical protein
MNLLDLALNRISLCREAGPKYGLWKNKLDV